jgi:hypothetical protein
VVAGSLPSGLVLHSDTGLLSGVPNTLGSSSFVVSASNSSGSDYLSRILRVHYTDVSAGAAFADDIYWLTDNHIATGFSDGTFRPAVAVARQAFAAYLYRYDHGGVDAGVCAAGTSAFPDVPDSSPFCGDIKWLVASGFASGFSDGTFRPANSVTRQAAAAFLYRYANGGDAGPCDAGTSSFPDVPDTSAFCGDIAWLASTEPQPITSGFSDGTFRPANAVTRQAMAAYLHRYDADFAP